MKGSHGGNVREAVAVVRLMAEEYAETMNEAVSASASAFLEFLETLAGNPEGGAEIVLLAAAFDGAMDAAEGEPHPRSDEMAIISMIAFQRFRMRTQPPASPNLN